VQFEQYKINTLNLDAKIDSNDKVPSKISLSLQQAQVSDLPVEGLQIDIGGTATRHTLDIVLAQDTQNRVTLKGFGSWKGNQWNLTIQETQMQTGQFGKWQQTQPAALKVTADDFSLALYCLHSDKQGNICGSVEAQNYRDWKGEARVQKIPFAVLKKFLPPQFDSTDVDLNGLGRFWYTPQSGAMLDFHASGENGVISGIKVEGKETPVAFNHFEFALSNVNKKLEATTSISIEDAGNIDMAISFPHWSKLGIPDLNERIQGHVEIDLTSLTVLSILSSQIKNPVGKWHGDIEISGTLKSPIIIGESRVKASSFTLATLGLELSDVDLVATADKKRNVTITGNARAGNGSINISGTLNDYRAAEPTGSIKISGKNFELVRIPEATIIVSPDLSLTLNQNAVSMTGDILISEADLKIFTPTKSITPSPDVVIVSEQKTQKTNAPLNISSKIRIILGDNVKVQGYGFTGRLHGSVLVDDTKELTTASGEINIVEGKYAAYGTTLDIARGSLSFAGSTIDNPLVDVRAERRIGDVIAGVLVQGNVKSPKISLFSDPPFDDSNVLSYIILGKPIDAASDQDGQLLANAAVSLGLLGGEKLAKEIADQFGIDEIKIQSDQKTNSTSVVLGKYLSPDFYVGYAIGIGNAVDTLQIQYKLTEQWVLKTQSGEQQKAELLFTIESD
ncbi:MAG: translocation/assembly module TamB domain-containing protein, partial [Gammaproteobacteria bacterium]